MHILIGLITAIAGLFWAINSLQRSGLDFNALNPFFWYRRHQWNKKYGQKPLYTIDNPLDAAAVLLLGIAKLEGEISKEHKAEILNIFSNEFKQSRDKATELFASTSFLLQSETDLPKNANKILNNSAVHFTPAQIESTLELMEKIANIESEISPVQSQLIQTVSDILNVKTINKGKWN